MFAYDGSLEILRHLVCECGLFAREAHSAGVGFVSWRHGGLEKWDGDCVSWVGNFGWFFFGCDRSKVMTWHLGIIGLWMLLGCRVVERSG